VKTGGLWDTGWAGGDEGATGWAEGDEGEVGRVQGLGSTEGD